MWLDSCAFVIAMNGEGSLVVFLTELCLFWLSIGSFIATSVLTPVRS